MSALRGKAGIQRAPQNVRFWLSRDSSHRGERPRLGKSGYSPQRMRHIKISFCEPMLRTGPANIVRPLWLREVYHRPHFADGFRS